MHLGHRAGRQRKNRRPRKESISQHNAYTLYIRAARYRYFYASGVSPCKPPWGQTSGASSWGSRAIKRFNEKKGGKEELDETVFEGGTRKVPGL